MKSKISRPALIGNRDKLISKTCVSLSMSKNLYTWAPPPFTSSTCTEILTRLSKLVFSAHWRRQSYSSLLSEIYQPGNQKSNRRMHLTRVYNVLDFSACEPFVITLLYCFQIVRDAGSLLFPALLGFNKGQLNYYKKIGKKTLIENS
jgi:hypothetical protein